MADEKTKSELAADERKKVDVNAIEEKKDDTETETKEEDKEEDDTKEVEETEDKEEDDKKEETAEGEEETEEVEAKPEDKDKEIENLKKKMARLEKRVGRTIGEKNEIKKELVAAKASLEAKLADGEQPLTEDEVERRSEQKAAEKLAIKEYNDAQDRLIKGATKLDKDFMDKVAEMAEEVAPMPSYMIGILDDFDNGSDILVHLTNNVDEYERIHTLSIPRLTVALTKISTKIEADKKPKPKKISNAPPPPETVGGNRTSPTVLSDKMPMDDWMRERNKQAAEHRKAKMR